MPTDPYGWLCGAFEPTRPRMAPYRCTEPHGHQSPHRAVIVGQLLAEWRGTTTHLDKYAPQLIERDLLAALEARWRAAYAKDPRPVFLDPPVAAAVAEARHAAWLASLTRWQRFRRWVWLNSTGLWTVGVLLGIVVTLLWWYGP